MVVISDGIFDLDKTEKLRLNGDYSIRVVKNETPPSYDESNDWDPRNINNQAEYLLGRVLIRRETENIDKLLKLLIRYTHDPCEDMKDKMAFINKMEQYRGGTICPTKKTLFTYEGKVFVYYGRYIFGYDYPHVIFKRLNPCMKNEVATHEKPSGFFGSFASFLKKGNENAAELKESDDDELISSEDELLSAEGSESSSSDEKYDEDGYLYISEKRLEDKITDKKIVLNSPDYGKDVNEYVYSFLIYDKETEIVDAFGLYR